MSIGLSALTLRRLPELHQKSQFTRFVRVGEDHVETAVGMLGGDGVEDFEAVAFQGYGGQVGGQGRNIQGASAGFEDDAVERD